jgi:magnesium transporter
VWRNGVAQDDFDFDTISELLTQDDTLVWVDIFDPDHDTLAALARELGLNIWAVEDAVAPSERVKATVYATHTFFTVYAVDIVDSTLIKHRISAFVLPRGLVTVRLPPHFDIDRVVRRWDDLDGQRYGVGALVHGLLDVVVDGHFEAVQALDDRIEEVEDLLFDPPPKLPNVQRRMFELRKQLVQLRRVVLPMREVINAIQHHRVEAQHSPELDPLYIDLSDHVLRASEWTESLRDMLTTVFETHLSLQDARLNTVMKKLTGWAAIIAVPTAITGFYGQNVLFPGFAAFSGFVISSVIIAVLSGLLYVMFKRRDWL